MSCFTSIDFTLTVVYSGGPSPAVFNFTLPLGQSADPNYAFNGTSGSISPGGTLIPGSEFDDALVSFTAPFGFSVYGHTVTAGSTIKISTNGFIRLDNGGSGTSPTNQGLPSAGSDFPATTPVLFPYWDDLDTRASVLTGGGIFSEVTGSSGSQTLKIEWRARHFVSGQTLGPQDTNFAVYFHENSNHFEYVYAQTGAGSFAGGNSATVGVQAATNGNVYTQFSFNAGNLFPSMQLEATQAPAVCGLGSGTCFSTAAQVSLTGRVLDRRGRGIGKVTLSLVSPDGNIRTVSTNSFGYYRFDEANAGLTYTLTATSRRYTFAPMVIGPVDDLDGLDFVSEN
jgi:hypothetical protein